MPHSGPSQEKPPSVERHAAPPRSLLIALLVALLIHGLLIFGMRIDAPRSGYSGRKTISITLTHPGPATLAESTAMATPEPSPTPIENVARPPEQPLPEQPLPPPKPSPRQVPAPKIQPQSETQLSFVGPPSPDVSVNQGQEQSASKAPDQKPRKTPGSSTPRDENDNDSSDEEIELAEAFDAMEDDDEEDEDEDEPEELTDEGETEDGDEGNETSFAGQTLTRPHSTPPASTSPSAPKPVIKAETHAGSSPSGAVDAPDSSLPQRHPVPAKSTPTTMSPSEDISRPTNTPPQTAAVTDSLAAPLSSLGKSRDPRDRGNRKGTASSSRNAGESDKTRKPEFSASLLSQQIAEVSADIYRQRSDEMRGRKIVYATEVKNHRLVVAAYERAWQEKVERIGNLNYPDEARRDKLSGTLTLAVGIKPDGSVYSVQIQKPSGHEALDNAAHNIVRLAAPFAPLPREISDEVDILVITRTWRFDSDYHLETRDR